MSTRNESIYVMYMYTSYKHKTLRAYVVSIYILSKNNDEITKQLKRFT